MNQLEESFNLEDSLSNDIKKNIFDDNNIRRSKSKPQLKQVNGNYNQGGPGAGNGNGNYNPGSVMVRPVQDENEIEKLQKQRVMLAGKIDKIKEAFL